MMKSADMPLETDSPERITSIEPHKKNKRRFSVFINEEYRFSVCSDIALSLRTGEILNPSRLEALLLADQQEQAYQKSLQYLTYRPRSHWEVAAFLRGKGFQDDVVTATLERLETNRYVDDEAFARSWIESRERHRPRGEFALRFEIRAKGIPDAITDKLLSGYDETEPAWRAISPKLHSWKTADTFELKKKIHAFLNRRGFSYGTCEAVTERALEWIRENG